MLPNMPRGVRQHRLDSGPFIIAEFVAHDSRLQFRSLNHVHAGAINRQWPVVLLLNALNLLPLSGHSGHGRTCCWLDPVAKDPKQTSCNSWTTSAVEERPGRSSRRGRRSLEGAVSDPKPVTVLSFHQKREQNKIATWISSLPSQFPAGLLTNSRPP